MSEAWQPKSCVVKSDVYTFANSNNEGAALHFSSEPTTACLACADDGAATPFLAHLHAIRGESCRHEQILELFSSVEEAKSIRTSTLSCSYSVGALEESSGEEKAVWLQDSHDLS